MHFKKILWGVVFVLAITAGYVGVQQNNYSQTQKVESKNTITIGAISILSGQFATIGEGFANGIKLAKEKYELEHPGVKINLILEDDAFDAKKGISAFKKLTAVDNIDALINISSPTIDAVHSDITKMNIPTIQFGIQSDGVAKDSIFQISPSPEMPITAFAEYIDKNTNLKKVAVVYENGQPFERFHSAFLNGYRNENEGLVSMKVSNKENIRSIASEIARGSFDGVVILGLPETGALLVKNISILTKRDMTYMIDVQLQTGLETYKKILGNLNMLDGGYSVWLSSGDTSVFSREYQTRFGTPPPAFADSGYDSFNVLIKSYDENKNTWISNMEKSNLTGVSGGISFDQEGIRSQGLDIMKIENGLPVIHAQLGQ